MAQGMEFRWMGGHPYGDEVARLQAAEQDAQDLDQLIRANAKATRQFKMMELGDQLNSSEAMQQVQEDIVGAEAMKREAEIQRWQELERQEAERKARFSNDPRMQMAAMLAMGGQPGALQSLLVSSVQQDIQKEEKERAAKKQLQSQMDALENGISNDLMYLAEMNNDQREKALSVSLPLFRAKMKELEDAGAVSRMGGMAAWEKLFNRFKTSGTNKRISASKNKKNAQNAALNY